MPDSMKAKRAPVPSVSYRGIRYERIDKPALRDLDPTCGYVVAIDEADDSEKWVLKVYESDMPEDIEDHKRNVQIAKLRLKGLFTKRLEVINERGARFRINLDTREIERL